MPDADVLIVGAGVAGLACACRLHQSGRRVLILERAEAPGGRVRTDPVDGFALDRGFQVLLTAYPTCRALLDFDALNLGCFEPGARIRLGKRDWLVSDPVRRPLHAPATLAAPIGSIADKLRIARLRQRLVRLPTPETWELENIPTGDWLRKSGFSDRMIEAFFRPFFSGIFLERKLGTSARMFGFVYKCFSMGSAALPAGGMEAIPRQMAARLPDACLRTGESVVSVGSRKVVLESGESLEGRSVVVATDGDTARQWFPELPEREWTGGVVFYYATTDKPVSSAKFLWLNGTGSGRINHIAVPSAVASGYAPEGRQLVSVNVLAGAGDPPEEPKIRRELIRLFGGDAGRWEFIRAYPVPHSLPRLRPGDLEIAARQPVRINGIYLCGDYLREGSLEGAMASGKAAAEAILSGPD